MKAEISIECDVITDYDEAKKQEEKGCTVWTIIEKDGKETFKKRLVKSNGICYIIMPKDTTEIVLFKREKWRNK